MSERDGDRMAVMCLTVGYIGICNREVLEDQTMYRLYEGDIDEGLGQEGTPDNFGLCTLR